MALRQIVSFAQLPTTAFAMPGATDFTPGPTRKLRGTPLYLFNNPTGLPAYVTAIQLPTMVLADGYLVTKRGWGNAQGNGTNVQPTNAHSPYLWLNEALANYSATSKFVIGFRFYAKEYKASVGFAILTNVARSTAQTLFAYSDIPNYKAGSPYYVELEFDYANLKVNRWVDGVSIASINLTSALVAAAVANGVFCFQDPQSMNVDTYSTGVTANFTDNATFAIRDIYVLEDMQDDSLNKRLGPQIVQAVAPVAADSTDWTGTPTGKSVLDTLNTPYTNAGIDGDQTSYVASSTNPTPLTLKFATPTAGQKVNGVALNLAAWRPTGTVGAMQSQVGIDAAKSAAKTLAISTVPDYSLSVGIFEKAPDGAAWTPDRVAKATLVLTPVAGG